MSKVRLVATVAVLATLISPLEAGAQRARTSPPAARASLEGPLARLFPADTFLYVEATNLAAAAEQMGGADVLLRLLNEGLATLGTTAKPAPVLTADQFRGIIDSSMAIGVRVPALTATTRAGSVEPVIAGVLQTPSPEVAAMARGFLEEIGRKGTTARATQQTVRGVRVSTFTGARPNDAFAYAAVGNDLVFGMPTGVTDVLATASGATAKRLADVPGYVSASNRVPPGRQVFAYLNGGPMVRAFNEGLESNMRAVGPDGKPGAVKPEAVALKRFLGVDAITGGSVSALAESGNLTVQSALEIDHTKAGLVSILADPPTLSMRAAALVPADTDLMMAASVDLVRIYDHVLQVVTPDVARAIGMPPPPTLLADFEAKTGLKFRDEFLSAIGSEVVFAMVIETTTGVARVSQDAQPPKPEPRAVALIEARDPMVLGLAVAKLTGGQGTAPEMSTHREKPMWTLGTVSWTLLDGFAVIGETREVRACIDAVASGDVLARSAAYEATVGTAPNNAITAVYASPKFLEWISKSVGVPADGPDVGRAFPSGVFYAVQKDTGGVYVNFQVALPNLRLLFEPPRSGEIGQR